MVWMRLGVGAMANLHVDLNGAAMHSVNNNASFDDGISVYITGI